MADVLPRLTNRSNKPVQLWPEWEAVFFSDARLRLAMGGEGSGKSVNAGLFATCRSLYDEIYEGEKLYWVVGKDFEDAQTDFFDILHFQEQLGNVASTALSSHRDQQCSFKTQTGQTFVTISAYDVTKLGREEPDGIVGAEVSRWEQEAFQRCEGRLLRKYPHAWGFFSGSFESSLGWLPSLFKLGLGPNGRGVRSYSIPTWANRYTYPLGTDDPAIAIARASMSPQRFLERFGGQPAPPRGIVLDSFRPEEHIDSELDYNPDFNVSLAIDPSGRNVYAVLFVQVMPELDEVWVIDEVYEVGWTHEQIVAACRMRPGWPLVTAGTIDVAGKQAQGGMPSPVEAWYKDTSLVLWAQKQAVEETIEKVRWALMQNPRTGRPRLRIHPRCRGLISEMGGGPSPIDNVDHPWLRYETRDGFGPPRPEHCDSVKALGYLLGGPYGAASNAGKLTYANYVRKVL